MIKIAILGSTGSIGKQTLQVIAEFPQQFTVVALTAHRQHTTLAQQIQRFAPKHAGIFSQDAAKQLANQFPESKFFSGDEYLVQVIKNIECDLLVNAIVGVDGIKATATALSCGMDVALANKEALVSAGHYLQDLACQKKCKIYPIDSEHSAIWQCLNGEDPAQIDKLILTASGGPFFGYTQKQLQSIRKEDALKHPTWQMGAKITIDSATLMNKGLEIIEAAVLFQIDIDRIDVLVHRQSIIHSMVSFKDGACIAQLGLPDMREPIQYALFKGKRQANKLKRLDLSTIHTLTFAKPDRQAFPCLNLAYQAYRSGGTMPAVLNTANQIAVEAFLADKIGFNTIPQCIEEVMLQHQVNLNESLEDVLQAQTWAKNKALQWLQNR